MSTAATLTADQDIWRPKFNPWLIAVVVAMAAFMEVLDTSIANVALPYMAGNLGASNDQSTWVLTSYLVSNAIVLPISGWLAGAIGRKRFFTICLFMFTDELVALRHRAEPGLPAFLPRAARRGRRRPATHGAGHSGGHVSAATARLGLRALRHHGRHGADDWSHPGRLDHVQLFLAMDFFHQSAGGPADIAFGLSLRRRSALFGHASKLPESSWTTLALPC